MTHPRSAISNERHPVVRDMVVPRCVVVLSLARQSLQSVQLGLQVACIAHVGEARGINVGNFRGSDKRIGLEVWVADELIG